MSMISSLIDELRKYANKADGTFPMLATALRDAADTIWQLRDDLQRANAAVQDAEHDESMAWDRVRKAEAENAKLREQVHYLMKGDLLHVLTDQEYIDQCERERLAQVSIDALDKENAKLRELLQRTWDAFHDATAREFVTVKNELRELGIEVAE